MIGLPFTLEAKLIAGALAALALAGALWCAVDDLEAKGAQGEQLAVAQQHAVDLASAAARNQQINTDQQEASREANRFNTAAALAAPRARDAAVGLQQRFAAINDCGVPDHSAAAAGSAPASSVGDLRADVFRRVAEAALAVASAADGNHGAGLDAEQHYDALTKSSAGSAPL